MQQIDDQIEVAFQMIEDSFADDLTSFLDDQGVTQKLRKISVGVVASLGSIDGYNVQPENGSITVIADSVATTQPLVPLATIASLYFSIQPSHEYFDFILACLSRPEFFEIVQLHHYFRSLASQSALKQAMVLHGDMNATLAEWDDDDGSGQQVS